MTTAGLSVSTNILIPDSRFSISNFPIFSLKIKGWSIPLLAIVFWTSVPIKKSFNFLDFLKSKILLSKAIVSQGIEFSSIPTK